MSLLFSDFEPQSVGWDLFRLVFVTVPEGQTPLARWIEFARAKKTKPKSEAELQMYSQVAKFVFLTGTVRF